MLTQDELRKHRWEKHEKPRRKLRKERRKQGANESKIPGKQGWPKGRLRGEFTDAHRLNMSQGRMGMEFTDAHRQHIRTAVKKFWVKVKGLLRRNDREGE